MRVLLDACVPNGLRRSLPGHEVRTAPEMGWGDLDNGDLLDAMGGVTLTRSSRLTSVFHDSSTSRAGPWESWSYAPSRTASPTYFPWSPIFSQRSLPSKLAWSKMCLANPPRQRSRGERP